MANRRMLKKKINSMVNNIIEECYSVQINNKDKHEETNKIIDETVLMFNELLERVHSVKSVQDDKEKKKLYDAINSDLEKAGLNLLKKLNKI